MLPPPCDGRRSLPTTCEPRASKRHNHPCRRPQREAATLRTVAKPSRVPNFIYAAKATPAVVVSKGRQRGTLRRPWLLTKAHDGAGSTTLPRTNSIASWRRLPMRGSRRFVFQRRRAPKADQGRLCRRRAHFSRCGPARCKCRAGPWLWRFEADFRYASYAHYAGGLRPGSKFQVPKLGRTHRRFQPGRRAAL